MLLKPSSLQSARQSQSVPPPLYLQEDSSEHSEHPSVEVGEGRKDGLCDGSSVGLDVVGLDVGSRWQSGSERGSDPELLI